MTFIGGHVSAAGGIFKAIENGKAIGANTIQIFGSSPRQWAVRLPGKEESDRFLADAKLANMGPVFLHAPYLVNLASPFVASRKRSISLLVQHMKIAESIKAKGLVVHVGSGEDGLYRDASLAIAAEGIKEVIDRSPGKTFFLIENCAGGGGKIGRDVAEVGWLIKKVGSSRVGMCLDTAHAFESGIVQGYTKENVVKLAKEIEKQIGWKRFLVMHANDSKTACGSKHDRHENIGKGFIGEEGFKNLLHHPKFKNIPFILEVPGFTNEGPDKKNVDILKRLANK